MFEDTIQGSEQWSNPRMVPLLLPVGLRRGLGKLPTRGGELHLAQIGPGQYVICLGSQVVDKGILVM